MSLSNTQSSSSIPNYMPPAASPIEVEARGGFLYFKKALSMPDGGYRDIVVRMWNFPKLPGKKNAILNPITSGAAKRIQKIYNAVLRSLTPVLKNPDRAAVVFTTNGREEECFGFTSKNPLRALKNCAGRYENLKGGRQGIDVDQGILPQDLSKVNKKWKTGSSKKVIDAMREISLILCNQPTSAKPTIKIPTCPKGPLPSPVDQTSPPPSSPKVPPRSDPPLEENTERSLEIFTSPNRSRRSAPVYTFSGPPPSFPRHLFYSTRAPHSPPPSRHSDSLALIPVATPSRLSPPHHTKPPQKVVKAASPNSHSHIYSARELFDILNEEAARYAINETPFFGGLYYNPLFLKPQVVFRNILTKEDAETAKKHMDALERCTRMDDDLNLLFVPGVYPIRDKVTGLLPRADSSLKFVRVCRMRDSYYLWGFSK